jgi:hypothetical protein
MACCTMEDTPSPPSSDMAALATMTWRVSQLSVPPLHCDMARNAAVDTASGKKGTDYVTGKRCDYIRELYSCRSQLKVYQLPK